MADEPSRSALHHLNNLFQVIMGTLELVKRSREVPAEALDIALQATREASALTERLLAGREAPEAGYEPERLAQPSASASSSAALRASGLPKK